jgi:hypothetical protein
MQIKRLFQVHEIKGNQYTKYIQIFDIFFEYFMVNQVQLDKVVACFKYHVYLNFVVHLFSLYSSTS